MLYYIRVWRKNVQIIVKYPGTTSDTHVNQFYSNSEFREVKTEDIRRTLRAAACTIGEITVDSTLMKSELINLDRDQP